MKTKYKCLYEITGRIEDVATFLVPIADLSKQEQGEPVGEMTPRRAEMFMSRFKHEEKMLGPNEQKALDYVIDILVAKQEQRSVSEQLGEPVACIHRNGSGQMVRDPDIGTDQECFVCEGSGFYEDTTPQPKQEQGEPVAWMGDNEIFDKLNHIYGDPKHHKYPLTKGQIVEFGRKLFELGANSSSPKVEQDPVAWTEQQLYDDGTPNPCALLKWAGRKAEDDFPIGTKFYTTPPQRKRLSGFGKAAIGRKHFGNPIPQEWYAAADDLEAAHGIKE